MNQRKVFGGEWVVAGCDRRWYVIRITADQPEVSRYAGIATLSRMAAIGRFTDRSRAMKWIRRFREREASL